MGSFGHRYCHPFHPQGCHDRSARTPVECWWRTDLQGLVGGYTSVTYWQITDCDPCSVQVDIQGSHVQVKGPKGNLESTFSPEITIAMENGQIIVTRPNDEAHVRALHGTTRAVLNNMVSGVSTGFKRVLEIDGVGYRPDMDGNKLVFMWVIPIRL